VHVAGAFVLCPMVEGAPLSTSLGDHADGAASKNSRPSKFVEYIARAIVYFAGTLPLAKAVRGMCFL
jgi:hypothetical protein